MSSIYNDPTPNPQPYQPPNPFSTSSASPTDPYAPPSAQKSPPPVKKSGCGCVGCLLGCLGVTVVLAIVAGVGLWYLARKAPDLARQAIVKAIEDSDLEKNDKDKVIQQVDRLVDGYKTGKVDMQKFGTFMEDFAQSPLMDLLIAFGAKVKYIDESDLTAEEKAAADKTLNRVARGVIEKKITQAQLDGALNHISTKIPNGGRQFKEEVSDEELRAFLTECKKLADEAMIPDEDFKVDVGGELKKLVDKALGEVPAEAEPDNAAPAKSKEAETPPPEKADAGDKKPE